MEISNAKLQEQTKENEELQAELDREKVTENTAELLASDDDRWCLALVNEKHPLDTSYVPANLTEISGGKQVDSRMADSLNKMLDDAKNAGLSMYVTSGYRSYEKQRDVFNTTMQDWINQGYTPLNAYDETKNQLQFQEQASMQLVLQLTLCRQSTESLMRNRGIQKSKSG